MTTYDIVVRNWRKFQHYKDRNPPWIKNLTELLHNPDYLELSSHRRGLLHGLWLEYASSNARLRLDVVSTSPRLRLDTRSIAGRLNLRVTMEDLEALNHAGFIELVASTPLANRLQPASTPLAPRARSREAEAEAQELEEQDQNPANAIAEVNPPRANGHDLAPIGNSILAAIPAGVHAGTTSNESAEDPF